MECQHYELRIPYCPKEDMKKILLLFLAAFVLFSFFAFDGINYLQKQLASLSSVITAWVTINPLEVEVSASSEVELNKPFQVRADIINKGEERIENVSAEIILPAQGLVLLSREAVQKINFIRGGQTKRVSWSVVGETQGSYIILVSASGELKGEIIVAEGNVLVEVKKTLPHGRLRRFFDFFQEWFRF